MTAPVTPLKTHWVSDLGTSMDYTDILIDIRKIVRSINLESKKIQKDFGISIPQLLCLNYLSRQEDYQGTHKELTSYLNLNSSTVTGIVNRLQQKGYVARLPKKGDRRITYVALTSAGYKVLESTPDLLHDKLAIKLSKLPDSEIMSIRSSLHKLVEVLGLENVDASPLLVVEEPLSEDV